MFQHSPGSHVPHRFSGILSADPTDRLASRSVFDEILLTNDDFVVTPTLGSILPLWLLVIPRAAVLNFASLDQQRGHGSAADIVSQILSHYDISPARAIWFEHGPSQEGSQVGCGVDHAHLHILIDPPFGVDELASAASKAGSLAWKLTVPSEAYLAVEVSSSYLVLCSGDTAYVTHNVDHVGSQFLRRQIATLVGKPDAWNYRTHPHTDNVCRTINALAPVRT
ncbi:hypothetical protein AB4Z01_00735 [Inquilinus sp. YAF38]|uniref:hypothetical protein n=1 Tax=Inquilinus sp. YAF38 TaxID=3233084 RepID=UPI003F910C61